MRNGSNALNGTWSFKRLATGAGGFVTGIDIADDGTMVVRTDTQNGYVRGPSDTAWKPLLRVNDSISYADNDLAYIYPGTNDPETGAYDCCIAPTNSNYIYTVQMGYIWKSTNKGATFTRTNFTQNTNLATNNGGIRVGGAKIRFDPAGTSVLGFCDNTAGFYYTTNGGTSWTLNSSIPAPTSGKKMVMAFDRTSSVVSGQTQTVYVFSGGNGLYKSTTGLSGTFSLVAGGPTDAGSIMVDTTGKLHLAGTSDGRVDAQYRYLVGSTWTSPASTNGAYVAVNPSNANKVYLFTGTGSLNYSADGGATFAGANYHWNRRATDIPWLAWTGFTSADIAGAVYHPTLDRIYMPAGVGVWYVDSPPTTQLAGYYIDSLSKGIEQLCTQSIDVTSAGKVLVACWDRAFFALDRASAGVYPSVHGSQNTSSIAHGGQIDYAIDDPNFLVGVQNGAGSIAKSTDGGLTWTALTPPSGTIYGNVAVSTKLNWVIVPTSDGRPHYTTDGGVTFTPCVCNATYDASTAWHHAFGHRRRCVVADKSAPGTFYMYCYGDSGSAKNTAMAGLWKTVDGGITWTRIYNTQINSYVYDAWHGKLKMVPGQSPHIAWVAGGVSGWYNDAPYNIGIKFSNNGGTSWTVIPGLTEPHDFCFGAPRTGKTYPTLYAFGWVGGVSGLYMMDDFDPTTVTGTWTLIERNPYGTYDYNITLAADPSVFGRIYYGLQGGGQLYADYADTAHAT